MPMPMGKKFDRAYVTLSGRQHMQFRKIAETMTKRGHRMNHATARGIMLKAMEKLARAVLIEIKPDHEPTDVMRLVNEEAFQSYLGDIIDEGI